VKDLQHTAAAVAATYCCRRRFQLSTTTFSFIYSFYLQPKPVLDGIRESEKHGNNGSLREAGKVITGTLEVGSNVLNKLVDVS